MDNTTYDSTLQAERQIAIGLGLVVFFSLLFSVYHKGKLFRYA